MKKIFGFIIVFSFSLVPIYGAGGLSDNLTVPHTFSTGDTISSSKINDNFNKIFEELNKIQKHIYSNGNLIAEFISFKNSYALGKTSEDYFIQLDLSSGRINSKNTGDAISLIKFLSTDCTGDMLMIDLLPKEVFAFSTWNATGWEYELYYTRSEYISGIYKSEKRLPDVNSTCTATEWNQTEYSFLKIHQNNSNTTGIQSVPLPTPITIK